MLSLEEVSVFNPDNEAPILSDVNASFHEKRMSAIVGASGSGKTTLIKALLGLIPCTGKRFLGNKEILSSEDLEDSVAFTPQFSIAYPLLSVEETLRYALRLRWADRALREDFLEHILSVIGLGEHKNTRVSSLSGGQLRRLGLGIELVTDSRFLICDEVTSGLDPRTEDQILELLRGFVDDEEKGVVCIIHNLSKLKVFDAITVVHEGHMVFQGEYPAFLDYFSISDPVFLFDRLIQEPLAFWKEKWASEKPSSEKNERNGESAAKPITHNRSRTGGFFQFLILLERRTLLFFRDRGCWLLSLFMTLAFPCIVVIFALKGLPQIVGLSLEQSQNFMELMEDSLRFRIDAGNTASLVTGIILFQVILLTLMGSNNGAREVANERLFYEKERLDGLRPVAYAFSKIVFVTCIACIQAVWMTVFVKYICEFPGAFSSQAVALILSCVSMSLVCLAFSAVLKSSEKASMLSIYLVGFQLPLSGIVLALPDYLTWVFRPFINVYWAWGGYFSAMKDSRFYDAFRLNDHSWLPDLPLCLTVLILHALAAIGFVFWGCYRKQW